MSRRPQTARKSFPKLPHSLPEPVAGPSGQPSAGPSRRFFPKGSPLLLSPRDILTEVPDAVGDILGYLSVKSLLACCCVNEAWKKHVYGSETAWHWASRKSGAKEYKGKFEGANTWTHVVTIVIMAKSMLPRFRKDKAYAEEQLTLKRTPRVVDIDYFEQRFAYANSDGTVTLTSFPKLFATENPRCLKPHHCTIGTIISIKLDIKVVAVITTCGKLLSWNMQSGKEACLHFKQEIFCFDFLRNTKIGAVGCQGKVILVNLFVLDHREELVYDKQADLSPVVAVKIWCGDQYNYGTKKGRIYVFSMDSQSVTTYEVEVGDNKRMDSVRKIKLNRVYLDRPVTGKLDSCYGSLCFDGKFLYCQNTTPYERTSSIAKVNPRTEKVYVHEIVQDGTIDWLLEVGEQNLAFVSTDVKGNRRFQVVGTLTFETRVLRYITSGRLRKEPRLGVPVCIGETAWLDGVHSQTPAEGVAFAALLEDFRLHLVSFKPGDEESK